MITEDSANSAPKKRASPSEVDDLRNTNAPPRNTMPAAAQNSGTYKVVAIAANASGNPVHR